MPDSVPSQVTEFIVTALAASAADKFVARDPPRYFA
jgi:hypothetical protein